MMLSSKTLVASAATLVFVSMAAQTALAQRPGSAPVSQPPSNPNPPSMTDNTSQPVQTIAPVSKQEKKAYNAFHDTAASEADKKTQLGEEFLEKFPQSRYRLEVVNWLAHTYVLKGEIDKLKAACDKELTFTPADPATLAVFGQSLSRAATPGTPNFQQNLDKAQELCKKSLDTLAPLKKPEDVSQEKFESSQKQTSSVAYSGLGLVAFRKAQYKDAISDLTQAVNLMSGGADPVDYYLLGKSNEALNNFSDALAAYTKCAAISSGMQQACKASGEDAKAHGGVLPK